MLAGTEDKYLKVMPFFLACAIQWYCSQDILNFTKMDLNLKSFLGLRSPVLGVCWTLTGVSTLLFSLRLTSRLFIKRGTTGWDDAVISLAWVRMLKPFERTLP